MIPCWPISTNLGTSAKMVAWYWLIVVFLAGVVFGLFCMQEDREDTAKQELMKRDREC